MNSCTSFPLSTRGPPLTENRPVYTLVRGWGIFNRLYGDFCTGADMNGVIRGDQADIVCNECGTVLRTVPAANVWQTLTELEIALEVASEMCPHCGSVNLFPGFSKMLAFTCRQCGKAVLRPGVVSLAGRAAAGHGLQKSSMATPRRAPDTGSVEGIAGETGGPDG